ncbi:hypothetical protein [Micromonospora aurantiaca (nom. illeg.)]|uniref:hypothetical protein n=1 Tax=Micromonospora aurantiaca (nom. illeg.) TaxID=47850 RepID=UPI0011A71996
MTGHTRPRPARPFTAPRPAARPAPARRPRRTLRRAVGHAAATATTVAVGAAAVVWLAAHGRLPQAGIAALVVVGYLLAEVLLFLRRHPAQRPTTAGPLADYTPQTVDRHQQWWEVTH